MRYYTTFLCGFNHIDLPSMPPRGERFLNDYFITKDRTEIRKLVEKFDASLGNVESDYLINDANAVVYRTTNSEAEAEDLTAFLDEILVADMLAVKSLELGLWRVKNNGCGFDRAWIALFDCQRKLKGVQSNAWATKLSLADGSNRVIKFSQDELRDARKIEIPMHNSSGQSNVTMLDSSTLRFERFQYFVAAARSSNDVAIKIAHYCTGLESLVSTAQQELSHQVSERVAVLLEQPGEQRISVFKSVKQAYNYRSKTVHGSSFRSSDLPKLCESAEEIDQICRNLFAIYLGDNSQFRLAVESSNEKVTAFFIEALLGNSSTSN